MSASFLLNPDGSFALDSLGRFRLANTSAGDCPECCGTPCLDTAPTNPCALCGNPNTTSNFLDLFVAGVNAARCLTCVTCALPPISSYRVNSINIDGTHRLLKTGACTWTKTVPNAVAVTYYTGVAGCAGLSTTVNYTATITVTKIPTGWLIDISAPAVPVLGGASIGVDIFRAPAANGSSGPTDCESPSQIALNTVTCSCLLGVGGAIAVGGVDGGGRARVFPCAANVVPCRECALFVGPNFTPVPFCVNPPVGCPTLTCQTPNRFRVTISGATICPQNPPVTDWQLIPYYDPSVAALPYRMAMVPTLTDADLNKTFTLTQSSISACMWIGDPITYIAVSSHPYPTLAPISRGYAFGSCELYPLVPVLRKLMWNGDTPAFMFTIEFQFLWFVGGCNNIFSQYSAYYALFHSVIPGPTCLSFVGANTPIGAESGNLPCRFSLNSASNPSYSFGSLTSLVQGSSGGICMGEPC